MAIIKVGDKATAPSVRPSLNLDFANSKVLDPRISFTRSSTGAYYDGKTFARGDENLFAYSQNLTNGYWDYSRHSLTAGEPAPDGTSTAYKFTQYSTDRTAGYFGHLSWAFAPGTHTFSGYFKAGANGRYVLLDERYAFQRRTYFDLVNGTVSSENVNHTASIRQIGNGWYRCAITFTVASSATSQLLFYFSDVDVGDGTATIDQNGESGWAWGLQYEQQSSVGIYTPTDIAPAVTYQPALQRANNNVPRFDHDPVTGDSKGLLIEETRTNLCPHAQPETSGWQYNATYFLNNYATAPDGTRTASYIYLNGGVQRHEVSPRFTATNGEYYTLSFYAKKVTPIRYLVVAPNAGGSQNHTLFDLQEGTANYLGSAGLSAGIQDVGNGWYRCHIAWQYLSDTGNFTAMYISPGLTATTNTVYTGIDGANEYGFLIWGAQNEVGQYPTSFIPTSGSATTRSVDSTVMSDVTSFVNNNEGTFHVKADFGGHSRPDASGADTRRHVISLRAGSISNGWFTMYQDENSFDILAYSASNNLYNGVTSYNFNEVSSVGAYEVTNGLVSTYLSVDGSSVSSDLNNNYNKTFDFTALDFGLVTGTSYRTLSGHLQKVTYYPEKLSDAEIQALSEE